MELNECEVKDYSDNLMDETGINENSFLHIDFDDSEKWQLLVTNLAADHLQLAHGPQFENACKKGLMYPKSNNGRKFSDTYYKRKMEKGELVPRWWLSYSMSTNSVFCFCCKVFASIDSTILVKGYDDWINVSKSLA
ncbi:zinc finger MYM-type protein 5-like [Stegodyphus dumicola]|uniref:zinc finger MYM-type protein 5-like n=1 Tax=Stegodyphus dumicola TaxID=202533 RepID=UPI0015B26B47|nr:zinc finger MYM-type protein 5-like [Stegodyphus dumicola]